MKRKVIVIFMLHFLVIKAASISAEDEGEDQRGNKDEQSAESGIVESFATVQLPQIILSQSQSGGLPDLTSFPYEQYTDIASSYGPPPQPQPSFGVSVNTQAVLAPQVEVIRFLEAFLNLISEILARLQNLMNENWDLVRAIINIIIGKVQKLQGFLLKGVGVLRTFLEFVLNLFSNWSLTLPSLTLGANIPQQPIPQITYGIPAGPDTTAKSST
ncbi:hypothetical protein FQA39_LY09339 [Lamprigera yunnana]|nr:hypothetical protein FQA39_LY09339 [Lamprigera yunnana]